MPAEPADSPVAAALRDNFTRLIAERTAGFFGREWVFDAVDQWLGGAAGGFWLLGGRPGTGKTAIAARLVQMHLGAVAAAPTRMQLRPGFLAHHHFCQAGSESTLSPQDFVQALAESLAARYPGYRESLAAKTSQQYNVTVNAGNVAGDVTGIRVNITISGGDARGLFDELVRRPLRDLATAQPAERIVILVDSLDEALTFHPTNNIARLVATAKDLPANVRFVLTSRTGIDSISRLVGEPTLDLITNAPPGLDEVQSYALRRLASTPEPARGIVAQRLAEQSRGNFLYAYHVLNLLESQPRSVAELESFPFPAKLEDLYGEMLLRQLAADPRQWSALYRPLLGAVAVAHGDGLSREQLVGVTGLAADIADDALNAASEFLAGGTDGVAYRLYHHSFREFLLRDDQFGVYPAERHAAVARWFEDQLGSNWESGHDDYGLRYTARHWAESVDTSTANTRAARTQSAVGLALNPKYQRAFEKRIANLAELRDVVFVALRAATLNDRADMLPCVVRASLGFLRFNRDYLQAEALVKMAEAGSMAEAWRRAQLFPDLSENWQNAARLILCWLTAERAPDEARAELARLPSFVGGNRVLAKLAERIAAALDGKPVGCPPVAPVPIERGREIVRRFTGNDYDEELLNAGGGTFPAVTRVSLELDLDGTNQYAAAGDAPELVGIACGDITHAREGTELFDRYVSSHAGYNYIVYRNESLWFLLEAAVCLMPDQAWVRQRLKSILVTALTGGPIEYREMLPMTAKLLRARLDVGQGDEALQAMMSLALDEADRLQDVRGANDVWGDHKRRLGALMELAARVAAQPAVALQLRQRVSHLPQGFAGFQAPALLRFADSLAASGESLADRDAVLLQATTVAQRIQDYHFCARINARCNALRRWHALALSPAQLAEVVARLVRGKDDGEFCSDHVVRDPFAYRLPVEAKLRSIEPARAADTLEQLAEVFQRPVADFQFFNPGFQVDMKMARGTPIRVPDPGLAPLLAVHFAARVLADPASTAGSADLIRSLIPVAAVNATALDTLLAYLLIAGDPGVPGLMDQIVELAGPVVFDNQPVPVGQVGPDSVLPA